MPKRSWKLIQAWKHKRHRHVWVVEDQSGQRGYFTFATEAQSFSSGPLIANEYVSAFLAKRLGIPVADLEQATVTGPDEVRQKGIVSLEVPALEITTWHEAPEEVVAHPEQHVEQTDLLAALVVFDAWIANIDRASGKNLILYRNRPDAPYSWYATGHGHALYGSPRKWKRGAWNARIWLQLWRIYQAPKGLLPLQTSASALEPMICKIESLKESDIDAALRRVPHGCFGAKERMFIRRLLLHRQKHLRSIMEQWLLHCANSNT